MKKIGILMTVMMMAGCFSVKSYGTVLAEMTKADGKYVIPKSLTAHACTNLLNNELTALGMGTLDDLKSQVKGMERKSTASNNDVLAQFLQDSMVLNKTALNITDKHETLSVGKNFIEVRYDYKDKKTAYDSKKIFFDKECNVTDVRLTLGAKPNNKYKINKAKCEKILTDEERDEYERQETRANNKYTEFVMDARLGQAIDACKMYYPLVEIELKPAEGHKLINEPKKAAPAEGAH
jgi:hypothetical protein